MHEERECGGEQSAQARARAAHGDAAVRLGVGGSDLGLELLECAEHAGPAGAQLAAEGGERDPAARPLGEVAAHLPAEPSHLVADRGRRVLEGGRGGGDGPGGLDGEESAQGVDVDH